MHSENIYLCEVKDFVILVIGVCQNNVNVLFRQNQIRMPITKLTQCHEISNPTLNLLLYNRP